MTKRSRKKNTVVDTDTIPTQEQIAINSSDARVKIVEAYAGSGKSWVLHREAQLHPDEHMLYLVYGRNAKLDADRLFVDCEHVDVRTIHGHAFRAEYGQWKPNEQGFTIPNIIDHISDYVSINEKDIHILGWCAHQIMTQYLNNTDQYLYQTCDSVQARCRGTDKYSYFTDYRTVLLAVCDQYVVQWLSKEEECPHDFYLKQSYIKKTFQRLLDKYDRVLVDEAQDLSPIMLACLDEFGKNIVLVGDTHQSIYSFRHVMNALQNLKGDAEFTLSKSFRFGNELASFITSFMQNLVDPNFCMIGNEVKTTSIDVLDRYHDYGNYSQQIYLSRTNLELIQQSMTYFQKDLPFYYSRDVKYIFNKLHDLWNVYRGKHRHVRDEFLKTFTTLDCIKEYAKVVEDAFLYNLVQIIYQYEHDMPDIIDDLIDISDESEQSSRDTSIGLSTVHAAKGQEYSTVYLGSDLYKAIERSVSNGDTVGEEYRIMYVAGTRAKEHLVLSNEFQEIIDVGWDTWRDRRLPQNNYDEADDGLCPV